MKTGELPAEQAIPVCSSPATINAGFELLVALAVGCVRNLRQIVDTLNEMYYSGTAHETCIDTLNAFHSYCKCKTNTNSECVRHTLAVYL